MLTSSGLREEGHRSPWWTPPPRSTYTDTPYIYRTPRYVRIIFDKIVSLSTYASVTPGVWVVLLELLI